MGKQMGWAGAAEAGTGFAFAIMLWLPVGFHAGIDVAHVATDR